MARRLDFDAAISSAAETESRPTADTTGSPADPAAGREGGGEHTTATGVDTGATGASRVRRTATRVAVLTALRDAISTEITRARAELGAGLDQARAELGLKSLDVTLPDGGPEVATVTVRQTGPAIDVDEQALADWVAEHHPSEITRTVRSAFRDKLLSRLTVAGE